MGKTQQRKAEKKEQAKRKGPVEHTPSFYKYIHELGSSIDVEEPPQSKPKKSTHSRVNSNPNKNDKTTSSKKKGDFEKKVDELERLVKILNQKYPEFIIIDNNYKKEELEKLKEYYFEACSLLDTFYSQQMSSGPIIELLEDTSEAKKNLRKKTLKIINGYREIQEKILVKLMGDLERNILESSRFVKNLEENIDSFEESIDDYEPEIKEKIEVELYNAFNNLHGKIQELTKEVKSYKSYNSYEEKIPLGEFRNKYIFFSSVLSSATEKMDVIKNRFKFLQKKLEEESELIDVTTIERPQHRRVNLQKFVNVLLYAFVKTYQLLISPLKYLYNIFTKGNLRKKTAIEVELETWSYSETSSGEVNDMELSFVSSDPDPESSSHKILDKLKKKKSGQEKFREMINPDLFEYIKHNILKDTHKQSKVKESINENSVTINYIKSNKETFSVYHLTSDSIALGDYVKAENLHYDASNSLLSEMASVYLEKEVVDLKKQVIVIGGLSQSEPEIVDLGAKLLSKKGVERVEIADKTIDYLWEYYQSNARVLLEETKEEGRERLRKHLEENINTAKIKQQSVQEPPLLEECEWTEELEIPFGRSRPPSEYFSSSVESKSYFLPPPQTNVLPTQPVGNQLFSWQPYKPPSKSQQKNNFHFFSRSNPLLSQNTYQPQKPANHLPPNTSTGANPQPDVHNTEDFYHPLQQTNGPF